MTQETDRQPSTRRRAPRAGRNRPVLVTSTSSENNEEVVEETAPTLEESLAEVEAQNPPAAPAKRRLPNFFSTVGKSSQTTDSQETSAAQARLARVTRSKPAPAKPSSEIKSPPKAEAKKEPARTAAAQKRPTSAFKTRYIIGMGLYLLGANFIGMFESSFFQAYHLDQTLTSFNLFGGLVVIKTSTVAFLATLVIILVLLARFDLIPRSFSALSGQSAAQRNQRGSSSRSSQNTSEPGRNTPPTMKQGVKGANDDLYQEYRANQRRERKK